MNEFIHDTTQELVPHPRKAIRRLYYLSLVLSILLSALPFVLFLIR